MAETTDFGICQVSAKTCKWMGMRLELEIVYSLCQIEL